MTAEEKYIDYVTKYANLYGLTIEEAEQHAMVKGAKAMFEDDNEMVSEKSTGES